MKTDLLKLVEAGGCSAKISPILLDEILKQVPLPDDPDILVDISTHDDAGVYRISDTLALVLTTDFFPPLCSDPYEFGQIAAANSISDVYAMGGNPVLALNIMLFPSSRLPLEDYAAILRGGADKAAEAGVRIIGGHTIDDDIPKYGLAVVGFIHPGEIITNAGAVPGDYLVLTKPIGTGIILAAQKLGIALPGDEEEAKEQMKLLNRSASEVMKRHGIRGATDITGYGLAGHALKMAKAGNVSIEISMKNVPLIGSTGKLADEGCIPGAAFRNLDFIDESTLFHPVLDYNLRMIACDAQTSGGILMCVPEDLTDTLLGDLHARGLTSSSVIGRVTEKKDKYLLLSN